MELITYLQRECFRSSGTSFPANAQLVLMLGSCITCKAAAVCPHFAPNLPGKEMMSCEFISKSEVEGLKLNSFSPGSIYWKESRVCHKE